jgi:hypothetical protein
VNDAAAGLGLLKSGIMAVCQNRGKSCKGFGWRFARPKEVEQGCVTNEVSEVELKSRLEVHYAQHRHRIMPSVYSFDSTPKPIATRAARARSTVVKISETADSFASMKQQQQQQQQQQPSSGTEPTPLIGPSSVKASGSGPQIHLISGSASLGRSEFIDSAAEEYAAGLLASLQDSFSTTLDSVKQRAVVVLDKDSHVALRYYACAADVAARLSGLQHTNIMNVCMQKFKSYKGFAWRFATPVEVERGGIAGSEVPEDELRSRIQMHVKGTPYDKPVMALDKDSGETLRYYESVKHAAGGLDLVKGAILQVCQQTKKYFKSCKGLGWRFARPGEVLQGQFKGAVSEDELKRRIQTHVQVSAPVHAAAAAATITKRSRCSTRHGETVTRLSRAKHQKSAKESDCSSP